MNTDSKSGGKEPENFEEALERLEELVKELEEGEVPLEKALEAFEEGQVLIKYCEKKLQAAEQTLKQLTKDSGDPLTGGTA
jgi:exodeoxyribonuclease VII small subunit